MDASGCWSYSEYVNHWTQQQILNQTSYDAQRMFAPEFFEQLPQMFVHTLRQYQLQPIKRFETGMRGPTWLVKRHNRKHVLKLFESPHAASRQQEVLDQLGVHSVLLEDRVLLVEFLHGQALESVDQISPQLAAAKLSQLKKMSTQQREQSACLPLHDNLLKTITDIGSGEGQAKLLEDTELRSFLTGDHLVHGDVGPHNALWRKRIRGNQLHIFDPLGQIGNRAYDWGSWALFSSEPVLYAIQMSQQPDAPSAQQIIAGARARALFSASINRSSKHLREEAYYLEIECKLNSYSGV